MNSKLPGLIFILSVNCAYSQCIDPNYCLSIDDTACNYHVTFDAGTGNIWQMGVPHNPVMDPTVCPTEALVTDTLNSYPINNHSAFTITNLATLGDVFGFRVLAGEYYVQTDSLQDYGTIELSLDKGTTWINIQDTNYSNNFVWFSNPPTFTGHSIVCNHFEVDLTNLVSIHPFQIGDTMLFRFSFFSDSVYDNLGGLIFDNICFFDFVEGLSELHFQSIKSIHYPNPASDNLTIEFDNPGNLPFEVAVYDIHSKRVLTLHDVTENKIILDTHSFNQGIYVYKITNEEAKKRCWARFVKSK